MSLAAKTNDRNLKYYRKTTKTGPILGNPDIFLKLENDNPADYILKNYFVHKSQSAINVFYDGPLTVVFKNISHNCLKVGLEVQLNTS